MYLWEAYANVIDFDEFLELDIDTSVPEEYFELLFGNLQDYAPYVDKYTYQVLSDASRIGNSSSLFIFYTAMYLEKEVDVEELVDYFHSCDLRDLLHYLYILTSIDEANLANIVRKEVVTRYNKFEILIEKLMSVDKVFAARPSCTLSELIGKEKYLQNLKSLSLLKLVILLEDHCYFVETMDVFIEKALGLYVTPDTVESYLEGIKLGRVYSDRYKRLFDRLDFSQVDNDQLLKLYLPYNRPKMVDVEVERRLKEKLFNRVQLVMLYLSPNVVEGKESIIYDLIRGNVELSDLFEKSPDKQELVTIYARETFGDTKRFLETYQWLLTKTNYRWLSAATIFSDYALEHGDRELKLKVMDVWITYHGSTNTIPAFDRDVFEYLLEHNKAVLRLYVSTALSTNLNNYGRLASIVSTIGNKFNYSNLISYSERKTINSLLNDQV